MADDDPSIELFTIEPERFVERRAEIVRALRAGGDKERAASVARMRKPTLSARALNVIARRDPERVESLLRAGASLAAAMGGDGGALRDAMTAYRAATDGLVAAAASAAGIDRDPWRGRLRDSAQAAATDPSIGELLNAGRLVDDHPAPGLDALGAASWVPTAATPKRTPKPTPAPKSSARKSSARKPSARKAKPEPERDELAERRAEAARRHAAEVARSEKAVDQLRQRARDARVRADAAEVTAGEAERELAEAEAGLDDLRRSPE